MSDCRFCEWTNGVDMDYENPSDERVTHWNQEKIIHLLEHLAAQDGDISTGRVR